MDPGRGRSSVWVLGFRSIMGFLLFFSFNLVSANVVFNVQHKFAAHERTLAALKAHDDRRHGRRLAALDLPLGGDGSPTGIALYYTKVGIGTPSNDYYVQVDTGSDLMWVNCAGCQRCPAKSGIGVKLRLYDQAQSSTGTKVGCEQQFCSDLLTNPSCLVGQQCAYILTYGDGSTNEGYIVKDTIQLDQASGNFQTSLMNGSISFGCGTSLSGNLARPDQALDGILGFGQAKSSMISQLASAGKVQRSFSHCLDGSNGGGIFAIGELVQPKLDSTPLMANQAHYNVLMTSIEVDSDALRFAKDATGRISGMQIIIDSGTTLAYLEDDLYNPLIEKILAAQPGLDVLIVEQAFKCFNFPGNIDDGFPDVTLRFQGSLSMTVRPHEYLFKYHGDVWCIGWQNSGVQGSDGQVMNLLGDMVLNNKLVLYDLENQTLGWTDYNCSSSIKVRDAESGAEYLVGSHKLSSDSSSSSVVKGWVLLTLLFLAVSSTFSSSSSYLLL